MIKKKLYLKDIAYEKIKEKVVLGEINSSDYLSENELVKVLNMSRTPIRTALQRLENEGYLKVYPNLGIKIEDLSIKDALNLHEYRNVIECFSLKKLLNGSQIDTYCELLEDNINKQKESISKDDIMLFMKLDTELHEIIVSASDNTLFIQHMSGVTDRLFLHGLKIFEKNPSRIQESLNEHEELLSFMRQKNIEKSICLLEKHLINGRDSLLKI